MAVRKIKDGGDVRLRIRIGIGTAANKIGTVIVVENDLPVAIVHIAELMQAGYI